jgi:transcriptional regulator with XRE-family HTH domain
MLLRVDRLREARDRRGWSQRELAERCGLSEVQVYRYENGKSDPSASHLRHIAEQLGVSADYLLDLSSNPHGQLLETDLSKDEGDLVEVFRQEGWIGVIRLGTDQVRKRLKE